MFRSSTYASPALAAFVSAVMLIAPACAEDAPTIDTEDASLGSAKVGDGWFHPMLSVDLRNGDFARGLYDSDAATLGRLPLHVALSAAVDLHRGPDGQANAWLVLNSSNGFHSPISMESRSPRSWYESNNLAGMVIAPAEGWRWGLAYAIKTSPNIGAAETTHEASLTASYEADEGFGALKPSASAMFRPRGGAGLFMQVGVEPELKLGSGDMAPSLSAPARIGVGWDGFYEPGSGDRLYGAAGLAYSHPFEAGGLKWSFRAEGLALVRDDGLRRLDESTRASVVPLATVALSLAY